MSRFPEVLPPPDGLASAFRDATRRRTRTAAATGGAGLLACCLVLAAVTTGGTQTLSQEPLPPAQQAEPPVLDEQLRETEPLAAQDDAERSRPPQAGSAPRRAATVSSAVPGSEPGAPHERPLPQPPRAAERAGEAGSARHPVERSNDSLTVRSPDCAMESGPVCTRAYAGVQGGRSYLDLYLCNATTDDVTLRFAREDEVDFEVRQGSRRHWRWSHGYAREASPHAVVVPVTACLIWTTTWPLVDQDGAPLPAGEYQLLATLDSADAGAASTAEFTFRIR